MARADLSAVPKDLARRREQLGLTQAELATICGISDRTISEAELGHKEMIRSRTLQRLNHALSLSPAEITRLLSRHRLDTQIVEITAEELVALAKVAKDHGGKLGMAVITSLLLERRTSKPPPRK